MAKDRPTRAIQLMPANGWLAVYADKDGGTFTQPLLFWALVENPSNDWGELFPWSAQAVVGLVVQTDIGVQGSLEDCDNFLGYLDPDEDADVIYGEDAKRHAAGRLP